MKRKNWLVIYTDGQQVKSHKIKALTPGLAVLYTLHDKKPFLKEKNICLVVENGGVGPASLEMAKELLDFGVIALDTPAQ